MQAYLFRKQANSSPSKGNAVAQKKSGIETPFQFASQQHGDDHAQKNQTTQSPSGLQASNIVQRSKAEVQSDLKGNKYTHLTKWNSALKTAVSGSGVKQALSDVINTIVVAVAEDDENVKRKTYDDLRKLIQRYNMNNNIPYNQIDPGIVPVIAPREIQSTSEYIEYSDSPSYQGMTHEETAKGYNAIFSEAPQIELKDKKDNKQKIPVLNSFAQAGRAIRYQQFGKDTINPIPFSVQQGDTQTLFEYRNDYVANPLKEQDGSYLRDGQIGSWKELIDEIDSNTTVQDIINIIDGNVKTQATQIQLVVAGAMVADTKNGIKNWKIIMENLPPKTTIKNLLTTEYKGFVDSRSYKTDKQEKEQAIKLEGNDEMMKEGSIEEEHELIEVDGMLLDPWEYDEYMEYKMKVDF